MAKQKILLLMMSAVLLLSLVACGGVNLEEWQAQYDLGIKYLNEGSYEEAIIAFTKAIEIDSKSAPSYVGRADAYSALAEITEDMMQTIEYYEKAISDYQKAAKLGNDEAENKKKNIEMLILALKESEEARDLLKPLYDCFDRNDYEAAVSLMKSSEYKTLCNMETPYLLYSEDSAENKLVLYSNNHCYYGNFVAGRRTGNGIWIESEATEKTQEKHISWQMYNGSWENDMPNGSGNINITLSSESQKGEYDIYPLKKEIKGEFKNGVYNGKINQTWHMDIGDVFVWNTIIANNGVYERIDGDNMPNGHYPVSRAASSGGSEPTLYSDGSIQYVFGFEK